MYLTHCFSTIETANANVCHCLSICYCAICEVVTLRATISVIDYNLSIKAIYRVTRIFLPRAFVIYSLSITPAI